MKFVSSFNGKLLASLSSVLISSEFIPSYANNNCVLLEGSCTKDCECCDHENGSRCEIRNQKLGKRCYRPSFVREFCTQDSDCISQKCESNICVANASGDPNRCMKSLFDSILSLDAVSGDVRQDDQLCPCTSLAHNEISENISAAIDKTNNADYVNNYPINSGLEVETNLNAPVRELKVCTNQDCIECDPMCYKIEGKCEGDTDFTLVQEGDLNLSEDRQTCTNLQIRGRNQFSKYRITFPCQRGGFATCAKHLCYDTPSSGHGTCLGDPDFDYYPLHYQSHEYDPASDKTYFAYLFCKEKSSNGNNEAALSHFILQWQGHCCFAYYSLYRVDTNYFSPPSYDLLKTSDTEFSQPDSDLCMEGVKIDVDNLTNDSDWFLVILVLRGEVASTEMEYGTFGNPNAREYNSIQSPDCSATAYVPPSCENYPMKVSEVDLLGKCNES